MHPRRHPGWAAREGLDQSTALYERNYQRQLLAIRAREVAGADPNQVEQDIFSERFLLERPLLAAIRRPDRPVLLIDEIDRADEEFEAFLLVRIVCSCVHYDRDLVATLGAKRTVASTQVCAMRPTTMGWWMPCF